MATPVFPVASGVPTHSGSYAPIVFAKKVLKKFYEQTYLAKITTFDWENDVKSYGDTIRIRTIPDITIGDYSIGALGDYEMPEPGYIELFINKGKSYHYALNLLQQAQSDLNYMQNFAEETAERIKIKVEEDVLGSIYSDAHADNKGTTAGKISNNIDLGTATAWETPTTATIVNYMQDISTVLTEQNCPRDQRYFLAPAAMTGLMNKSDLKNASLTNDAKSTMRTGYQGDHVAGMAVYETNLLTRSLDGSTYVYNVIAGHPYATAFASGLVHNEEIDNPRDFGKLVRGLHAYGYEVIKPEFLVHFYATV